MKRLFYNPNVSTKDITDDSGKKTKAQIVKEFGGQLSDWKETSFNEKTHQCIRKPDGTFEKKTHTQVQQELKQEQQIEQDAIALKMKPILKKMGLNKKEAQNFLEFNKLTKDNVPTP